MKILYNIGDAREALVVTEALDNPIVPTFLTDVVVPYFMSYSKAFGIQINEAFINWIFSKSSQTVSLSAVKQKFICLDEYIRENDGNLSNILDTFETLEDCVDPGTLTDIKKLYSSGGVA